VLGSIVCSPSFSGTCSWLENAVEIGDHSLCSVFVDWDAWFADGWVDCFDLEDAGEVSTFSLAWVGVDCGCVRDMCAGSGIEAGFVCT
jgi:hypothetical protein